MTKEEKNDLVNELIKDNKDMNAEIGDKTHNAKTIQKAGRNYIKKVKNEKIEQDNINKEYLTSIFPQNEKFDEENPYGKVDNNTIKIDAKNVTVLNKSKNAIIRKQIFDICNKDIKASKLTPTDQQNINEILFVNNKKLLGSRAISKKNINGWLIERGIYE